MPRLFLFLLVLAMTGTAFGQLPVGSKQLARQSVRLLATGFEGEMAAPVRPGPMELREPEASVITLRSPQEGVDLSYIPHEANRHFGLAVAEVAILEFIPWALARYVRTWEHPEDNWARVDADTWWNNLSKAWEYDGDNFLTNQFAHPYHGALFFNAARTNGYSFWESYPFSLAGSALWEFFGETFRPAFNDWVATGTTGAFFGEGLYRVSSLITDNTATGSERVWREIGGALVNPVRGFNRLITGETGKQFANLPEHDPSSFYPVLSAGVRRLDADGTNLAKDAVTQAVVSLDMYYGSVFSGDYKTPFSSFQMNIAVAFPNRVKDSTGVLNRLTVHGVLHGWKLSKSENASHYLVVDGLYDYWSNPAFEFGQTSVAPDWLSRYRLSETWDLETKIGLRAILMGGTPSDYYLDVEGRDYDFGPGVGSRVAASFIAAGWPVLTLVYTGGWIWTQSNPSKSKHNFHLGGVGFRYPLSERLSAGLTLAMYWRESFYERGYYESISPGPPQPFDDHIARKNPIAQLTLSYVAW
ncbi:MAG: DUF3943 domain-containing protein [Ignavibacteria bacterium]|nr:DUF3943 domain-containing protein [Ignavibacteria bacterium]